MSSHVAQCAARTDGQMNCGPPTQLPSDSGPGAAPCPWVSFPPLPRRRRATGRGRTQAVCSHEPAPTVWAGPATSEGPVKSPPCLSQPLVDPSIPLCLWRKPRDLCVYLPVTVLCACPLSFLLTSYGIRTESRPLRPHSNLCNDPISK